MSCLRLTDIFMAKNPSRIKNLISDYFSLTLGFLLCFRSEISPKNPRNIARLYLLRVGLRQEGSTVAWLANLVPEVDRQKQPGVSKLTGLTCQPANLKSTQLNSYYSNRLKTANSLRVCIMLCANNSVFLYCLRTNEFAF